MKQARGEARQSGGAAASPESQRSTEGVTPAMIEAGVKAMDVFRHQPWAVIVERVYLAMNHSRPTAPGDEEVREMVERLRAKDAKWQRQCDEWISEARKRGEVSAEHEAVLRKTWEADAADLIERLAGIERAP